MIFASLIHNTQLEPHIETAYFESPIGLLELQATHEGLTSCQWLTTKKQSKVRATSTKKNLEPSSKVLRLALSLLKEYWAERPSHVDLSPVSIDFKFLKLSPFYENVYKCLMLKATTASSISYSELSIASGHPRATQAVGQAMKLNPIALFIPCHRVLAKDPKKRLLYNAGAARKAELLKQEGLFISH